MTQKSYFLTLASTEMPVLSEIKKENIAYLIIGGQEKAPTTGWLHHHIYINFKKSQRHGAVKKIFGKTVNIQDAKGDAHDGKKYATKPETKTGDLILYEYGTIPVKGKRNDIEVFKNDIEAGLSKQEMFDKHFHTMARYPRLYNEYSASLLEQKAKKRHKQPVDIIYIYGTTGTGKTTKAYEFDENLYTIDHSYCEDKVWFDGYTGQDTVLFDDFRGGIKFSYMLKLLDTRYMQLAVKFGFTHKAWKRVIITSNIPPEEQYQHMAETNAPFLDRIDKVIKMEGKSRRTRKLICEPLPAKQDIPETLPLVLPTESLTVSPQMNSQSASPSGNASVFAMKGETKKLSPTFKISLKDWN